MKAFLIDPFAKTVTEVDYNGKFEQAYKLMDCDMIEFNQAMVAKHTLLLDEDGRFKHTKAHFRFYGNSTIFVNCALLTGGTSGNKDATITIEALQSRIEFLG